MKASWRRVVKQLERPGAFLTRARFGRMWVACAPLPGTFKSEDIEVRDSTVEEMRKAGVVVMRIFGNTQMLGLPEEVANDPIT